MSENQGLVPVRPIGNIYCGTCSWTDRTLIESGGFYPAQIRSPEARLRYYAQVFPIVEVDSTYYALPSEQNARLWAERTPPGFVFNIKAFGLLTQHPVDPRRLPDVVRERLPSDVTRGTTQQEGDPPLRQMMRTSGWRHCRRFRGTAWGARPPFERSFVPFQAARAVGTCWLGRSGSRNM